MAENEGDNALQRKRRIAGIFDRAAPTYDHVGPRFFAHFGQALVDFTSIQPGANVLDIASGRGAVLFPAAGAAGKDGLIVGTDISESMVEQTRRETRQRKLRNARILVMDAESLQFPDESFDFVLCGFALFFFPHFEQALAEIRRVLRPGGCLAVSTWEQFEDESWSWFDKLVETFLPPEPVETNRDVSAPPPPRLDTPEGLEGVLGKAGFTEMQHKTERFEVIYQDKEEWWLAQWSHGARGLLEMIDEKLGADGLERFKVAVFEQLSMHQPADGLHTNWPALYVEGYKPKI